MSNLNQKSDKYMNQQDDMKRMMPPNNQMQ
jgi:hypothetical protein